MAEVLVNFDEAIHGPGGREYLAQACGRVTAEGLWEGWVEFRPLDGGPPVTTARETTQPNRTDTIYWATGLSVTYLEGALDRALRIERAEGVSLPTTRQPGYAGPAPHPPPAPVDIEPTHAVLDPFAVFTQGEGVLRGQLAALSRDQLTTLITAHDLIETPDAASALEREMLEEMIVAAVRRRLRAHVTRPRVAERDIAARTPRRPRQ